MKGNRNKKIFIILLIANLLAIITGVLSIRADDFSEIIVVELGEGGVDEVKLTKTINIPYLKQAEVISVSSGSAEVQVVGNDIIVTANNGEPTRTEENLEKHSKHIDTEKVYFRDEFPETVTYEEDDEGYSGTLYKTGTPIFKEHWMFQEKMDLYVEAWRSEEQETQDGLMPQALAWIDVNGPTYIIENPEIITTTGAQGEVSSVPESVEPVTYVFKEFQPMRINSSGGTGPTTYASGVSALYQGAGYQSRGEMYFQDYVGTTHKPGVDKYHSYVVEIKYVINTTPKVEVLNPTKNQYVGAESKVVVKGTVTDPDEDMVTISIELDGVTKTTTVQGPITKGGLECGMGK